jgi:chromosome segregation ATPase
MESFMENEMRVYSIGDTEIDLPRQLTKIEECREKSKQQLELLELELHELGEVVVELKSLKNSLSALFDRFEKSSREIQRGLLRQIFNKIVVARKNEILIEWQVPKIGTDGKFFLRSRTKKKTPVVG